MGPRRPRRLSRTTDRSAQLRLSPLFLLRPQIRVQQFSLTHWHDNSTSATSASIKRMQQTVYTFERSWYGRHIFMPYMLVDAETLTVPHELHSSYF